MYGTAVPRLEGRDISGLALSARPMRRTSVDQPELLSVHIALISAARMGRAAIALAITTAFFGCGAPTSPTRAGAGPATITVTGVTVLAPGLTTQLVATIVTATGSSVPSGIVWQSRAPDVATVSSSGLVTAVTVGSATIVVTSASATGQAVITVQPTAAATTTLSSCGIVNVPGNYTLDTDLIGSGAADCITVANVADLQLDCHNHSIMTGMNSAGLNMSNVNHGLVANCVFTSGAIVLSTVSGVTISRSTITQSLHVTNGSWIEVSDTTITGSGNGVVFIHNSANVQLVRDTISNTASGTASAIEVANGSGNRIVESTIRSVYDGSAGQIGTDDAILLVNESGDDIAGNSIAGFFDMGVEGVDTVSGTTIENNAFSNIGVGAIGSIYCTAWMNNVIQTNRSTAVPLLVFVGSETDSSHCGSKPPGFAFSGNQFVGNTFRSPIIGTLRASGPSMSVSMQGIVTGNLLQGNDFGAYDGPRLTPLTGFIDGGGNICGPLNPAISNFPCSGGTSRLSEPPQAEPPATRPG